MLALPLTDGGGGAGRGSSEGAEGAGEPVTTPAEPGGAVTAVGQADFGPVATDDVVPLDGGDVDVVISFAAWSDSAGAVEVGGYVQGVLEAGGECTVSLTRDGAEVTAVAVGEADATVTGCGVVRVPGSDVPPGAWQAVLAYDSATSQGRSEPVTVEVPVR